MATSLQSSGRAFDFTPSDSLLICAICHSQLNHPKVLECQHMFCMKCLKDQVKAEKKTCKTLKCAVCRKKTKLPSKGVVDLPENYVINGIIGEMKKREKCEQMVATKSAKQERNVAVTGNAKGRGKKAVKDKNDNPGKKIEIYCSLEEDSSSGSDELSPLSDEEDSQEEESEDESEGSEDSYESDDEDDSDSCISGDDSDIPQTPTLKEIGSIKVGMKVYVFSKRRKRYNAIVRFLETFERKPPGITRSYAGVSLEKDVPTLITEDIEDMDDTYLSYWLGENPDPCAVVRVDQCIPRALLDKMIRC